jgi:hypothetical protein
MKPSIILCIILLLVMMPSVQSMEIYLHAPNGVQINGNGYLFIEIKNETGAGLTGRSNDVFCYVRYPNGTVFMDGVHPREDAEPGAYYLEFKVEDAGCYPCWISCNESIDAALFQVGTDVTDEATKPLSDWIGAKYDTGKNNRYETQQRLSYLLTVQKGRAQNVTLTKEQKGLLEMIQDVAIGQSLQVLFWSIVLFMMGVIGTFLVAKVRRRKVV